MLRMTSILAATFISSFVWAHAGHHHPDTGEVSPPPPDEQAKIQQIGRDYETRVKPIFEKSCYDCHSTLTKFPSYASWPIAKQLIEYDRSHAIAHIDMTNGFPFKSHASPDEDLDAIRDTVNDGDMPPWRYWIFHSGTKLTDEQKKVVSDWATEGLKTLGSKIE